MEKVKSGTVCITEANTSENCLTNIFYSTVIRVINDGLLKIVCHR